ncbi:MAG: hypothetical protein KDA80_02545 [Planctomycetaceae bacterium]|nr:hypothetical protein [Planctomycetaceae bacterium]
MRSHLKEAVERSAEIQKPDGSQAELPNDSQIGDAAQATGKEFSRMIPQSRVREVALARASQAGCPTCGEVCHPRRSFNSIDGLVPTLEPKAYCHRCRPCSRTAG